MMKMILWWFAIGALTWIPVLLNKDSKKELRRVMEFVPGELSGITMVLAFTVVAFFGPALLVLHVLGRITGGRTDFLWDLIFPGMDGKE